MKTYTHAFVILMGLSPLAFAQLTEKTLPTYPPPYGAFVMDQFGGRQSPEQFQAAQLAIAKSYGYATAMEARTACFKARKSDDRCTTDPVAHRRDESPEIAKYGFADWRQAVDACLAASRKAKDKVFYCTADPFIKLRSGR